MDLDIGTAAWMLASGLATTIGGAALFLGETRLRGPLLLDALLGFPAGVMLAAAVFSLLVRRSSGVS